MRFKVGSKIWDTKVSFWLKIKGGEISFYGRKSAGEYRCAQCKVKLKHRKIYAKVRTSIHSDNYSRRYCLRHIPIRMTRIG